MTFIRKIKTKYGVYLAEVKSYRDNGKVRQKVIKYIGKELGNKIVRNVSTEDIKLKSVKQSLDVLAIHKMANELGLTSLKNKHILALVYAHLLEQRSINKMEQRLRFTEIPDVLGLGEVSSKDLYSAITDFHGEDFGKIENDLAETFKQHEKNKKVAVIDVTDTYFEGKSMNVEKRKGKDGKVRRLVQVGLAVSFANGFPIMHKEYHGNLSNVQILKDMALNMQQKGTETVIIDRGMESEENIDLLRRLKCKVIAGIRKNKTLVKKFILSIDKNEIFSLKNMIQLKNTKVYIKSFKHNNGRMIVVYNPSAEVVRKELNFEKGVAKNSNDTGFSLLYHNTELSENDITKKYYEKEIIERAFKQLKGVLKLRPIRMWLKGNIESHIRICYLAYAILAFMNFRLKKIGISGVDALESLKYGYKATLTDKSKNYTWNLLVPLEPKQKQIMKHLGVVYKN